jgi:hypothetical protein
MFCKNTLFFINKVIVPLTVGIVLAATRKRMKMHSDWYSKVYNVLKFRYFKYIFQIIKKYVTFLIVWIPNALHQISLTWCFSYEGTTNFQGIAEDAKEKYDTNLKKSSYSIKNMVCNEVS